METHTSTIEFFLNYCQKAEYPDQQLVVLHTNQTLVAEGICKAVKAMDSWLLLKGFKKALLYFPNCKGKPYRFDGTFANFSDSKDSTPDLSRLTMSAENLNPNLLGADYIKIHEFLIQQRTEGNIVIITSNVTRDAFGKRISTENPEAGRDLCHHTNDLLLPNRAYWAPKDFTGYNYRLSWRRGYDDYDRLNPQYHKLKELLERDGFIKNYQYTLYRPDGAYCEYSTDYYLCRDYLGDEVRIGISKPQDWRLIVSAPEQVI